MEEKALTAKQGTIRQILLITDGCSNVGSDPVQVANEARRKGIVVNVIGVVDEGELGRQGKEEALSIADAGAGMCRVVQPTEVSATAQMMTHQTMQMTLQQVVNMELLQVMGKSSEELEPVARARVAHVIDKLEDILRLELVVAVDTSASMHDKMDMVKDAIRDLSLSLQAREGETSVAVVRFPGPKNESTDVVQPFSTEFRMDALQSVLAARGGTPTGPALQEALRLFDEARESSQSEMRNKAYEEHEKRGEHHGEQRDGASNGTFADTEEDLPDRRWDGTSKWSS